MVNSSLKKYIEKNIFPHYALNDKGHNLDHIQYVIRRSLSFANQAHGVDEDMAYTVACYHDAGHHIDAKHHEIVSAQILREDIGLRDFFSEQQIEIMAQAVEDHRASGKTMPRSIYGKIVSTADRSTDFDNALMRCYEYNLKHGTTDIEENMLLTINHLKDKYGESGYALSKSFFKDVEYEKFLSDVRNITKDEKAFRERFMKVNRINICEQN